VIWPFFSNFTSTTKAASMDLEQLLPMFMFFFEFTHVHVE
jgi:hypothetical protein